MDWRNEGMTWPHREQSRFIETGPVRWRVVVAGDGPDLLLLHGAGSSAHTWHSAIDALSRDRRVIAPDLPGQGFSRAAPGAPVYGLPDMAAAVATLLKALDARPERIVGHSAGAPLGTSVSLDHLPAPCPVTALNGAFAPFEGPAATLFPQIARVLAATPFSGNAAAFAMARPGTVSRLLSRTGDAVTPRTARYYETLLSDPAHAGATLRMMAHWNTKPLLARLPAQAPPLKFILGRRDGIVPPAPTAKLAATIPDAAVVWVEDGGHLMHEQDECGAEAWF